MWGKKHNTILPTSCGNRNIIEEGICRTDVLPPSGNYEYLLTLIKKLCFQVKQLEEDELNLDQFLLKENNLSDVENAKIAIVNLGLKITLPANTTSYTIATGSLIEDFVILDSTGITFKIGTTVGGSDIISPLLLDRNEPNTIGVHRYFENSQTIYFGGISSITSIIIYKR